jgi:CRP-like cAMP-binding protein
MCLALMKQMADRVKLLTDLAGHLTLNSVESRIARWLLDESVEGSIQRKKWLTQNEMASIVGTVPDVTSRILRNFVEEGLIRFDRREIKITDRNSLAEKVRNLS